MSYESRHADHYNRREPVQGLSLRLEPGEPPALGTGLLPSHPTRRGRVAGELTPERGSRAVPDRRGAWGYRFSPEPGAGAGGAGSFAGPSERRRYAGPDRQGKEVDHLFSVRAEQVRAEDPVCFVIDDHLEHRAGLRHATVGIPV